MGKNFIWMILAGVFLGSSSVVAWSGDDIVARIDNRNVRFSEVEFLYNELHPHYEALKLSDPDQACMNDIVDHLILNHALDKASGRYRRSTPEFDVVISNKLESLGQPRGLNRDYLRRYMSRALVEHSAKTYFQSQSKDPHHSDLTRFVSQTRVEKFIPPPRPLSAIKPMSFLDWGPLPAFVGPPLQFIPWWKPWIKRIPKMFVDVGVMGGYQSNPFQVVTGNTTGVDFAQLHVAAELKTHRARPWQTRFEYDLVRFNPTLDMNYKSWSAGLSKQWGLPFSGWIEGDVSYAQEGRREQFWIIDQTTSRNAAEIVNATGQVMIPVWMFKPVFGVTWLQDTGTVTANAATSITGLEQFMDLKVPLGDLFEVGMDFRLYQMTQPNEIRRDAFGTQLGLGEQRQGTQVNGYLKRLTNAGYMKFGAMTGQNTGSAYNAYLATSLYFEILRKFGKWQFWIYGESLTLNYSDRWKMPIVPGLIPQKQAQQRTRATVNFSYPFKPDIPLYILLNFEQNASNNPALAYLTMEARSGFSVVWSGI